MSFVALHFDSVHLAAAHGPALLASFDVLEHVRQWMHSAGYPVLFGLLLSCGVGLPLPEDVPLLLAGFFVAKGEMHLFPAAVSAWCGIIGGDCILYGIGRKYGMAITSLPIIGSHIKREQIEKLHEQFEKYGWGVVAVGRLFAGVRGAMVLVAGTIRFTFSHFIIADGVAAIFSGGIFLGLGYYAGHRFGDLKEIHESIEKYSGLVLLGLVVALAAFAGWMWVRQRRRRGFVAAVPPPAPTAPDAEPAPHTTGPATVTAVADSPSLPPA